MSVELMIRVRKKGGGWKPRESGPCADCGRRTTRIHYQGFSSWRGYFVVRRCGPCLDKALNKPATSIRKSS